MSFLQSVPGTCGITKPRSWHLAVPACGAAKGLGTAWVSLGDLPDPSTTFPPSLQAALLISSSADHPATGR